MSGHRVVRGHLAFDNLILHHPVMHAQLLEEVRKLPVKEQVELVDEIMEGLPVSHERPAHLSPWQEEELKRRIDGYDADPSCAVPWEEVRAGIEKEFGWKP